MPACRFPARELLAEEPPLTSPARLAVPPRIRQLTAAQSILILCLAWGALAFGAVYPWGYWPLAVAALVAAALALTPLPRWRFPGLIPVPLLAGIFVLVCAAAIQLVPLPLRTIERLSPETARAVAQLDSAVAVGAAGWHPLSVDPQRTAVGIALLCCCGILFAGASRLISLRGPRPVANAITVIGALIATIGIVQQPLYEGRVYGFWTPQMGGNPFGPFINKNHFAGWMLMALPVTLGLVFGTIARATQETQPTARARLLWFSTPEANSLLLQCGAAVLMAVALVLTMSRSAIGGGAVALLGMSWFAVRNLPRWKRTAATAGLLLLGSTAVGIAGPDMIVHRFERADWTGLEGRRGAWADALTVAHAFPVAGTGLNTYGTAMLLYQRHDLTQHYAEAHNDYLQLAAEGGFLLLVPFAGCVTLLVVTVRNRFAHDGRTTPSWIRAGAAVGIAAIAIQEAADFSLQMPGNAVLFAVICAIACHEAPAPRPASPAARAEWVRGVHERIGLVRSGVRHRRRVE